MNRLDRVDNCTSILIIYESVLLTRHIFILAMKTYMVTKTETLNQERGGLDLPSLFFQLLSEIHIFFKNAKFDL